MPDWYTHGGYPSTGAPGASVSQRQEWASVSESFAKLPALTGNGGKTWRVKEDESGVEVYTTPVDPAPLGEVNVFTKNQSVEPVDLTSSTNIAVDFSLSNVFFLTLTHDATLMNPSNLTRGMVVNFVIAVGIGSDQTLAFDTKYRFPPGVEFDGTAGTINLISCLYDGDDRILCGLQSGYEA